MRRLILVVATGAFVALATALAAGGAVAGFLATPPTEISVADNSFTPSTPPAQPFHTGASFHWQRAVGSTGNHNIVQDAGLFTSGQLTTGPIDYSVNASAGTYHYYCQLHGTPGGSPMDGMSGIVKVAPLQTDPVTRSSVGVEWADSSTTTGSLYDVRFKVGGGHWTTWLNDTAKTHAVFGKKGKPVKVKPGKTYQVEVRSELTNTKKHSGWSPPLKYKPTG